MSQVRLSKLYVCVTFSKQMLCGKTAVIIGATSDIGEGIVHKFVNWGVARFILHGRDAKHLRNIVDNLRSRRLDVTEIAADLLNQSDYDNLKSKLQQIEEVDIFVYTPGFCGEMDPVGFIRFEADFLRVLHVNFTACAELFEICIPHLRSNASAVFISSTNSRDALACGSAYCTTKCAMKTLMNEKALELGDRGIRVNTVGPGLVATKMHEAYFDDGELEEYLEHETAAHPLGRIASVEGVANAVAFLCSDRASDITGTEMTVDCGASLVEPSTTPDCEESE